ncbi:winged helix-turn-helix domain-containing protein [Streptomyces griseoviridis]|uniref:winged helix-turn-helix domain-containing protein n=1 Tax=Streptomyces griseoviridis TaxID=45398 RepID=UPI0033EFA90C
MHLTVKDLSRIRLVGSLGLDLEARFAELRYADTRPDEFADWRMKVRRRLRQASTAGGPGTDFLRRVPGAPPHADTRRFSSVAVVPFWGRIRNHLEQEREARGRAVLSGGVESLLNELHPSISWHAPLLHVDDEQEGQRADPLGEGLVIAPSLFAPGPMVLDAETGGQDAPVLVYNVSPTTDTAAGLWEQEGDRTAALSDLLGHTRANVLESLRSPMSISEISRRLDLSHPSVSRHLGVLRRSGMVAPERRENLTLHRLTHLGETVLGRRD